MATQGSWYEVVTSADLMQGDLLLDVPIPMVTRSLAGVQVGASIPATIGDADVVVMSQSCDLADGSLESVLVAQFDCWSNLVGKVAGFTQGNRGSIRRGNMPHLKLLRSRDDEPILPWCVVDFRELHTLPSDVSA